MSGEGKGRESKREERGRGKMESGEVLVRLEERLLHDAKG